MDLVLIKLSVFYLIHESKSLSKRQNSAVRVPIRAFVLDTQIRAYLIEDVINLSHKIRSTLRVHIYVTLIFYKYSTSTSLVLVESIIFNNSLPWYDKLANVL